MVTKCIKKHMVAYLFVGIKDGYNHSTFNVELALKSKINLLFSCRGLVLNFPELSFIVNRRNRFSPVINKKVIWLIGKGCKPDIYLFGFIGTFFTKINASKVRFLFKSL